MASEKIMVEFVKWSCDSCKTEEVTKKALPLGWLAHGFEMPIGESTVHKFLDLCPACSTNLSVAETRFMGG